MVSSRALKNIIIILMAIILFIMLFFLALHLFERGAKEQCNKLKQLQKQTQTIEEIQEKLYVFAHSMSKLLEESGQLKLIFPIEDLPIDIRKSLIDWIADKNAKLYVKPSLTKSDDLGKYWVRKFYIVSTGSRIIFHRGGQDSNFRSKVICRD